MKPIIAILVGHHGPGTGAVFEDRDEWDLNMRTTLAIYDAIERDKKLQCSYYFLNRDFPGEHGQEDHFKLKAYWVRQSECTAVIEIHHNTSETGEGAGNELVYPIGADGYWISCLNRGLATLPNNHRNGFPARKALFRLLPEMPVAIVEPAFLYESQILTAEWREMVAMALKYGIYKYFFGEDDHA